MSEHRSTLFRDVEVEGELTDVLVVDGEIRQVGRGLRDGPAVEGELDVVDGDGGALVPGLHDHHIHLAASAAAMDSVHVGPPEVTRLEQFADALADADARLPAATWIRAVGYHESVAGPLDRDVLDRVMPHRPVRVQDRSGVRWTMNSVALDLVGVASAHHPGILRDDLGRPTGQIDRADDWLRDRVASDFPDLTRIGRALADVGVTRVTDCTPYRDASGPAAIAAACARGELPQLVFTTGGVELLDSPTPGPLRLGPVKLVLDDDRLSDLAELVECIRLAHRARRPVAIHIVTPATLAFAIAAWRVAGVLDGDRIEHGSVISEPAAEQIAGLGLTVVTQPGFVAERGDQYLVDVDADEIPDLYRCATLRAVGVRIAAGSDAPYTDLDPWRAIRAATDRRTRSGVVLGPHERLPLDEALGLFLGDPLDPGRRPRRVTAGASADLCLLTRHLHGQDAAPNGGDVRATYREGIQI